jgi:hypothetical protein
LPGSPSATHQSNTCTPLGPTVLVIYGKVQYGIFKMFGIGLLRFGKMVYGLESFLLKVGEVYLDFIKVWYRFIRFIKVFVRFFEGLASFGKVLVRFGKVL